MLRKAGNRSLKAAGRHPVAETFLRAFRRSLNPRHRQDEGARPSSTIPRFLSARVPVLAPNPGPGEVAGKS
jgi:hypothetical protein